ncbi:MAG TPA: hypothetical protein VMF06_09820, partial [Candidatus Limnocylindria bacterium]|nr:hypothetical protein [Candidatus Limnocylindria bacterium]
APAAAPEAPKPSGRYVPPQSLLVTRALESAARAEARMEDLTFGEYVRGAFTYPFKGDGPIILISGTLLFALLRSTSSFTLRWGLSGGAALVVLAFSYGYFASMVMSVVQATANGEPQVPTWPDVDGWKDYFFKWTALYICCLGPGWGMMLWANITSNPELTSAGIAFYGLGILYLPMALLAMGLSDSYAGLNPMVVFPWVFATFGQYLIVVPLAGMALAVPSLCEYVIKTNYTEFSFVSIIGLHVISSAASLWAWFVVARMLGGLYRANRDKLEV